MFIGTAAQDEFLDISSPLLQKEEDSWFQNDEYDEQDISDTDPLEELDALANQQEFDLLQQYDLDHSPLFSMDGYNNNNNNNDNNDNINNTNGTNNIKNRQGNNINNNKNQLRSDRIDGILWPFIRPIGELIYEKIVFGLFFIVYSIKETLLSMIALLDAATSVLLVNSVLWILYKIGLIRDFQEWHIINRREQSQPVFQFIAVIVYFWIFYAALCYYHEPTTIIKYHNIYDSVNGYINANNYYHHHSIQDPTAPPPPTDQYGGSDKATTHEQNTDTIRETVERILSNIIPSSAKNGDFLSNLQTYMNDHYVQRTELQEKELVEDKTRDNKNQQQYDPNNSENNRQLSSSLEQDSLLQQVADFALATRGARIIPKMTSATYILNKKHPWKAAMAQALGIHPGTYRASPLIAILPETHVGQCWPMDKANGTLGIVLSQPINIKSITMEYPAKDKSMDMTSAPQDFEIWGLRKVHVPLWGSVSWPWHKNDTNASHLGTFRYDIQAGRPIQTFNVVYNNQGKGEDDNNNSNNVFDAVIVRVLSNWGLEGYTCLYRVRVHGEPAS